MPDRGLQEAIRAAGGVTELARRIGISQPSVSNWTRVPAERVLTVEAVTGVARAVLRPDLYDENNKMTGVDEVDLCARAGIRAAGGVAGARAGRGVSAAAGRAARRSDAARRRACRRSPKRRPAPTPTQVEREFFNLFIGIGRGELMPYGSYYLTGFLHERPLARLREDLGRARHRARRGQYEPEDHAAILCEIMAGIAGGQFPAPAGADRATVRKASGALDRPLLRRSGARRSRGFLPARRDARPGVYRDRNGGFRAV